MTLTSRVVSYWMRVCTGAYRSSLALPQVRFVQVQPAFSRQGVCTGVGALAWFYHREVCTGVCALAWFYHRGV